MKTAVIFIEDNKCVFQKSDLQVYLLYFDLSFILMHEKQSSPCPISALLSILYRWADRIIFKSYNGVCGILFVGSEQVRKLNLQSPKPGET